MKIPEEKLQEVREKTEIISLVSDYTVLEKTGNEWRGLCPFHAEKNPSFYVNEEKKVYCCRSCNVGGDSINFIKEMENLNFTEAILRLGEKFGVEIDLDKIEPEKKEEISKREKLYQINASAVSFFQRKLKESPETLKYLKERNINLKTIDEFQLGFIPSDYSSLFEYLLPKYEKKDILDSGLFVISKSTGKDRDRFWNRLIIPIRDIQGRTIGFGGRALGENNPKYLNSPETLLFKKSQILFNLDKAKEEIKEKDALIIVEGFFDAIALFQAGVMNVVATQGTALKKGQILKALSYSRSKRVYFNFDNDSAGKKALRRAIKEISDALKTKAIKAYVINLQESKDPGEFLEKNSPEKYLELMRSSKEWLNHCLDEIDFSKKEKKEDYSKLISSIAEVVTLSVGDESEQLFLIKNLAKKISINQFDSLDSSRIEKTLESRILDKVSRKIERKKDSPRRNKKLFFVELGLIKIYVCYPFLRRQIESVLNANSVEFNLSVTRELWHKCLANKKEDFSSFIYSLEDEYLKESKSFPFNMNELFAEVKDENKILLAPQEANDFFKLMLKEKYTNIKKIIIEMANDEETLNVSLLREMNEKIKEVQYINAIF